MVVENVPRDTCSRSRTASASRSPRTRSADSGRTRPHPSRCCQRRRGCCTWPCQGPPTSPFSVSFVPPSTVMDGTDGTVGRRCVSTGGEEIFGTREFVHADHRCERKHLPLPYTWETGVRRGLVRDLVGGERANRERHTQ
jgi:hypothetical protein